MNLDIEPQETGQAVEAKRPFYDPGWYPDMSNEEYHGSFGYSSSNLKVLLEKTMAHLNYKMAQQNEYTEATLKGQVLHTLAMEPHLFDKEFAIQPAELKRPTAIQINAKRPSDSTLAQIEDWNQWQDSLGDRTAVPEHVYEHAEAMAKKVRAHPFAGKLLESGIAEQSVFYWYNPEDWDENNDYRIMCKVRTDWIMKGHNCIFDLKSTRDAAFTPFMRQARKLGYHVSAAMYLDGANRNKEFLAHCRTLALNKFAWIVVENEPPYEVAIYEMSPEDRDFGLQRYHTAARRLYEYKRSNWKGYGEFIDGEMQPIARATELPKYGDIIV